MERLRSCDDVREGREEGRGAPYLAAAALLSMAESWNHDLFAAENPVSAVGPALPPAGGGADPEIVRRAFVPAASAGHFWLALPWRRGRLP